MVDGSENAERGTRNSEPGTRNPELGTRNPEPGTQNSGPGARNAELLRGREFHRILLIKPSHIGDVVHALPVLAKLRARYPEARIDWFITRENADLVRHHPDLSDVVIF